MKVFILLLAALLVEQAFTQNDCSTIAGTGVISAAPSQSGSVCPLKGTPAPEKYSCAFVFEAVVKSDCTFTLSSIYPGCSAVKGSGTIDLTISMAKFKLDAFKCIEGGVVKTCTDANDDFSTYDLGVVETPGDTDNTYHFFPRANAETCITGCGSDATCKQQCIATAMSTACGFQISYGAVMGIDIKKTPPLSTEQVTASKKSTEVVKLDFTLDKNFGALSEAEKTTIKKDLQRTITGYLVTYFPKEFRSYLATDGKFILDYITADLGASSSRRLLASTASTSIPLPAGTSAATLTTQIQAAKANLLKDAASSTGASSASNGALYSKLFLAAVAAALLVV